MSAWRASSTEFARPTRAEPWHEEYVTHVGAHWCFHDEARVADEARAVAPDPEGFFAAHRSGTPVPLDALVPVAWMRSLPMR